MTAVKLVVYLLSQNWKHIEGFVQECSKSIALLGYWKKDVTQLLLHWSYVFPALTQ